jgi:hypothetical protein
VDTEVLVGVTTGSANCNKDMKSVIRGEKNKSEQKGTCFNVSVFIHFFQVYEEGRNGCTDAAKFLCVILFAGSYR